VVVVAVVVLALLLLLLVLAVAWEHTWLSPAAYIPSANQISRMFSNVLEGLVPNRNAPKDGFISLMFGRPFRRL
jgi:hypothetical protein